MHGGCVSKQLRDVVIGDDCIIISKSVVIGAAKRSFYEVLHILYNIYIQYYMHIQNIVTHSNSCLHSTREVISSLYEVTPIQYSW